MRRLATLIGLTLLLIIALAANANSQTTTPPSTPDAEYAPGRLLVRFAGERAPAALAEALAPFAATVAAEIAPLGVYRLNVPIGQELTVAERLRRRRDILYAEPDYIFHATIVPNDPHYASRQWNLPHINAPAAWDVTTGAPSLTIAVIDTGVDLGHPDLSSKLVAGYDFANGDNDPQDAASRHKSRRAPDHAACPAQPPRSARASSSQTPCSSLADSLPRRFADSPIRRFADSLTR